MASGDGQAGNGHAHISDVVQVAPSALTQCHTVALSLT